MSTEGAIKHGVEYSRRFGLSYPFIEFEPRYKGGADARITGEESDSATDQTPTNRDIAKVRQYDLTAIGTAFAAFHKQSAVWLSTAELGIPNELEDITVRFNKSAGTSIDEHLAADQEFVFVGSGSASLNPRASSRSSGAVSVTAAPAWKGVPERIQATLHEVILSGDITESAIKTAIGGAPTSWPLFKPRPITLILEGQQVSASATAETQLTGFVTAPDKQGYAYEAGKGSGTEGAVRSDIVQIPACIHGTITFSPDTDTVNAEAEATADLISITVNAVTVSAISNGTGTISKTATATITGTGLSATSPSAIPVTGTYLADWSVERIEFGYAYVKAWTVDMTQFA